MSKKKELIEFANNKGIELTTQMKLSRYMVGEDKIFSELSSNNASMILTNFNTDGHTHWINAATGQTDITDGDQQNGSDIGVPADVEIVECDGPNDASAATENNEWEQVAALNEDKVHAVFNDEDDFHYKQIKKFNDIRLIKFEGNNGFTYWLQGKGDTSFEAQGTEIIYVDDEPFEVTPAKRKAFQFHDQEMKMGWLKASFHLAITLDNELYKVAGYNTQEEYAKFHHGESYGNLKKKAKNGRRILAMLPKGASMHLSEMTDYDEIMENVADIGPTKFYELTKFDESDFDLKQLAESGEATLPSGDTISIEEIKSQTAKEVGQKMKKERKKLQKRIANLEEDKKTAEWERDHYREQVEAKEEYIKRAEELENMYGQTNANVKDAYTAIDKTKQMLREVESVFGPVDTLDWDSVPDTLTEEVKNVLHIIHRMQISAMDRFPFLHDIEDLEAFPSWKVKGEAADGRRETGDVSSETIINSGGDHAKD